MLKDSSWTHDFIPEIMDGKNVADFVDADPDIAKKIDDLERETALMGAYDSELEDEIASYNHTTKLMDKLRSKIKQKRLENQAKKSRNTPIMPRRGRSLSEVETTLKSMNYDTEGIRGRSRVRSRRPLSVSRDPSDISGRKRRHSETEMQVDDVESASTPAKRLRALTLPRRDRSKSRALSRDIRGVSRERDRNKAGNIAKRQVKARSFKGMKGEADRFIGNAKPKHLFCGKRGIGKTDRR